MKKLILIATLLIHYGCDTTKMVNRAMDNKYKRHDFTFQTFKNDTYQLTYWDNGTDKPPVILIHGFGTWAKFNWHKQIKELGENHRLIIPNLLHFGQSTCYDCGYTVANQVAAIELIIDELKLEQYVLVGASYGGVVAVELNQKRPDSVDKLIIVDSPIKFFTEGEVKEVENHFGVTSINDLLIPSEYIGLKELSNVVYKKPHWTPKFAYRDIYNDIFLPNKPDMQQTLSSLLDQRNYFAEREYKFNNPVLLIWGDEDMLVPKRVGFSLNEYFGNQSQLHIIENTAHMPILEKPKTCNEVILKFLE